MGTIFLILAVSLAAGGAKNPATLGGAWPASLLGYGGWPEVDGALALRLIGVVAGGLFIWNQVQQARGANKPPTIQQPISIETVKEFVTVPQFNDQITRIDGQCQELKKTIDNVLVDPKGYLHSSVHAVRNGLDQVVASANRTHLDIIEKLEGYAKVADEKADDAIKVSNASVSKAHARMDSLAQQVGVLIGETKHIAQSANHAATAAQSAAVAAAEAMATARKGGRA